jgi:hypothetical protein
MATKPMFMAKGKIARENAVNKIWPLMGYALKDKLAGGVA